MTTGRDEPEFETWHGEVFSKVPPERARRGIYGFSRVERSIDAEAQSADSAILTYTLYNEPAYEHIRSDRLYLISGLQQLQVTGDSDREVDGDRSVPPFPTRAIVLKTAWWPVARNAVTAMPVWDPEHNPPRRGGNPYITWQRVVAIDPVARSQPPRSLRIGFAGFTFANARRVGIKMLYHVVVDGLMAERMMRDPGARKAALIALGRPLSKGDYLVLVGANLATRELSDWVWASLWWHDRPNEGPFAEDRPDALRVEWRNYLLQAAFDSDKPTASDGGAHICFNPWLEGRFPDTGQGGGTQSNCMACHRRASYPPVSFLPVTRGAPELGTDPAYRPGRLRTSFLWSLAMHARP
jgi:hypothetical protein